MLSGTYSNDSGLLSGSTHTQPSCQRLEGNHSHTQISAALGYEVGCLLGAGFCNVYKIGNILQVWIFAIIPQPCLQLKAGKNFVMTTIGPFYSKVTFVTTARNLGKRKAILLENIPCNASWHFPSLS